MRIAYITAGAAGMYCGTCMHDNALAATLIDQGHEVALTPVYTPLRTDETSVTIDRVFFGAINVYLQQKLSFFRHTPWILDRLLDRPKLLNWVSRFSVSTNAHDLGALTLSMLEGEEGRQSKELEKLVSWLADDYKPDIVHLSHSLFLGFAHRIKERLGIPVVCSFQGEDIFYDDLEEPWKSKIIQTVQRKAREADAFTSPCADYTQRMSELLDVETDRIHQTRLGIQVEDFLAAPRADSKAPLTIGFLARICPEKGLHTLLAAFRQVVERLGRDRARLEIAGYVGARDAAYLEEQKKQLNTWGISDLVTIHGEVDRQGKTDFLHRLDLFSVPTTYREPKGIYVLEALASCVATVLPRHGAFPEILERTGGGILVEPHNPDALAAGLIELIDDPVKRQQLAEQGQQRVLKDYNHQTMTAEVLAVYRQLLGQASIADQTSAA